jgi:hypothetical protein
MASIAAADLLERIAGALLPAPVRGSGIALIVANLLPLYGVLAWDWPVYHVMALYWAENIVAGLFTLLRMVAANPVAGLPLGAFFCFHYGMFCFVHGTFVHALFSGQADAPWPPVGALVQTLLTTPVLLVGVLLMLASHGWSFVAHALAAPAEPAPDLRGIMMRPYGRMVVLHVTILAGGFLTMSMGEPVLVLVPLIVLKIVIDLYLHRRANAPAPAPAPAVARRRPYEIR